MKPKRIFETIHFIAIISLVLAGYSIAENESALDVRTVSIDLSTNMVCGTAKRIIEKALNKVEGIIEIDVDPENRKAVVTYDDNKMSVEGIEREITKLGYDANDKKGDPDAYQKLPDCCKTK